MQDTILHAPTNPLWFEQAVDHLPELLIDHAHCEKKAARMALQLINAYPTHTNLVTYMTQLGREELLHLRQVLAIIHERKLRFVALSAPHYAAPLHAAVATKEPHRCAELLICGALIEARSCERFDGLGARLATKEPKLAQFYRFLYKSEKRHYHNYLELAAELVEPSTLDAAVTRLAALESSLVNTEAPCLRMHSGPIQKRAIE